MENNPRFIPPPIPPPSPFPNGFSLNPNRLPGYRSYSISANKFSKILATLKSQENDMDGTYERSAAYTTIENSIPPDLSLQDAISCLKMLNYLISRSHRNTIVGWIHLVTVVNTCIENLIKHQYDFKQFSQEFPHLVWYMIHEPGFFLLRVSQNLLRSRKMK